MEKIRINSIEMKGPNKTICVVGYGALDKDMANCEATLNTKWQSQEVNYLQNDVGLGGEVSVLIEQKGQYTNITKVDFASAVKGNVPSFKPLNSREYDEVHDGVRSVNGQEQKETLHIASARDFVSKDKSIIVQCLVKAVIGQTNWPDPWRIEGAVKMYKEALELLG